MFDELVYFSSREIATIGLLASLWGVINSTVSPTFFQMFGIPILCDMIGFAVLTLSAWRIGRFGVASTVGVIATLVNFFFNPGGIHFIGFTVASVFFDMMYATFGYKQCFKNNTLMILSTMTFSVLSAALAGAIIGAFFMAAPALIKWGGVLGWAGIHSLGGAIGGMFGIVLVSSIKARGLKKL